MQLIIICFLIFLSSPSTAQDSTGAMGIEAGVARMTDGHTSIIGHSEMFHFEYQVDPIVGFFGQAGTSRASEGKTRFSQNAFSGGVLIEALEVLEFRVGFSSTVLEIEKDSSTRNKTELAPMA